MLTTELMKQALPKNLQVRATQDFVDKVNLTLTDPDTAEMMRDNILSYAHVLKEGKYKLDDYINAVKYVSHKLMNKNNTQAYLATFPSRQLLYQVRGTSKKDITTYASSYNKNKLVNLIYEQTLIPTYILNAGVHQNAINVLANLMTNARSEKVQADSANALLTHLKRPEAQKVELDISVNEGSKMDELRHTMKMLAFKQQELIHSGAYNAKEIAHQSIVLEGEIDDV